MTGAPTLAIDFGTTNSVMAWINPEGQAELIHNQEGETKTPSLVYYGDEGVLVGKYASAFVEDEMRFLDPEAQARESARVMRSVKRQLGRPTLIALPGGKTVRPVEVAAEILMKLKRDAEEGMFHEPVRRAVLTYPAAFDAVQRRDIEQAARRAGFEEIELLAEPEAAALAYTRLGRSVGEGVLVYDLGGGTFDLSLLQREEGEDGYRLALENEGDAHLGGDDIDQLLHDHCLKLATGQLGAAVPGFDLGFLYDCRKRKENLSGNASQTFSSLIGGRPFRYKMERGEFEALIEPLVERTVRKTKLMLKRAQDAGVAVDSLVLIGGSSRIPLIERRLRDVLSLDPLKFHQTDCAVALGAAYSGEVAQPSITHSVTSPTVSVCHTESFSEVLPTGKNTDVFAAVTEACFEVGAGASAISASQDAKIILIGFSSGKVFAKKLGDSRNLIPIESHHDEVRALELSKDSRRIFSGGKDSRIKIYKIDDGNIVLSSTLVAGDWVLSIAPCPDNNDMLLSTSNNKATLWDINKGKEKLSVSPGGSLLKSLFSTN